MQFSLKEDDKSGTKLKNKLVGALTAHLNSLAGQEVQQLEQTLDEIQLLIMRVFAAMTDDKRIVVLSTMFGPSLQPMGVTDRKLLKELNSLDTQEVVANMDDLAAHGILSHNISIKGTPNYSLAKQGYEIVKILKNSQE